MLNIKKFFMKKKKTLLTAKEKKRQIERDREKSIIIFKLITRIINICHVGALRKSPTQMHLTFIISSFITAQPCNNIVFTNTYVLLA